MLGLVFFYLFTQGECPLEFNIKFSKSEVQPTVKIDLLLLDDFRKDTDSILFIDLIKRMIRENPEERETCDKLIQHAVFKNDEELMNIVEYIAKKCFTSTGDNEYMIKIIDKDELHLEGFLEAEFEPWNKFTDEMIKYTQLKPDIKTCSSLLRLFTQTYMVIHNLN